MPWFRRAEQPPPLPAQVRAGLGLARHERVLTHAAMTDGTWVIATTAALVLVDPVVGPDAGPGTPRARHLWHEVAEATWEPEVRCLVIDWAEPAQPQVRLTMDERESYLPEVLRERVVSSYVLSQRVELQGRRGVTVAVRRHSGDGSLFVQTVPDHGVDLARPQVADQVASLRRDLQSQAGLVS